MSSVSTDDMVCVLGKDAFTLVCVLASYADTCSGTCANTHQHTREKSRSSVSMPARVCVCVCVCVCARVCVCMFVFNERRNNFVVN